MNRILIVHTAGGLGDVLLSTCVIHALGQAFPGADIDFLCLERNSSALQHHPRLRQVLTLSTRAPRAGREWVDWVRRIRNQKYDAALVLWSVTGLAWMLLAASVPIRVGQDSRLLYSFTYTHRVRIRSEHGDTESHWTEILLDYVRALGLQPGPAQIHLQPSLEAQDRARLWLDPLRREQSPLVGFHSTKGLQLETPRWPTAAFAHWAKALHQQLGATLVFTGTAADREIVSAIREQAGLPCSLDLCGQTGLEELAAVAQQCDVFVCPDSGPMHVAAAAGARVVGIYALEEDFPQRWAPHCQHRRILRPDPVGCRPGCIKATCPDFRCYHTVKAQDVVEAVRTLLVQELSKS